MHNLQLVHIKNIYDDVYISIKSLRNHVICSVRTIIPAYINQKCQIACRIFVSCLNYSKLLSTRILFGNN